MIFRARQFEFTFPRSVMIMGIVNVTPDSFSDGGRHYATDAAVAHAFRLVEEGADLIDVGGESTRPGATLVSAELELKRVIPVIELLRARVPNIPISIDTQKAAVASAAITAGANIINDIAANRSDPEMWKLAASTGAGYIAMHMQGTPQTMQNSPGYRNVVADVETFFKDRLERLRENGVKPEQVALDVGIGFGKTVDQNIQLLGALSGFQKFNRPLLLGVSRKSFIEGLTGAAAQDRLPGSLAAAVLAARDGVQIVRVHDVAATRQALQVAEAVTKSAGHVAAEIIHR
jgi:dihydropteroate synthase